MLGDEQHAGRVAIEAVHEARTLAAEAVGHAGEHAIDVPFGSAAALHGEAERLVEHEDVLVLVEDHALDAGPIGLGKPERRLDARRRRRLLGAHDLRHADIGAGFETLVALDPAAVDAHLSRAQQLLQIRVADIGKVDAEPPVKPHVGLGRLHFDGLDAIVHGGSDVGAGTCAKYKRTAKRPPLYPF